MKIRASPSASCLQLEPVSPLSAVRQYDQDSPDNLNLPDFALCTDGTVSTCPAGPAWRVVWLSSLAFWVERGNVRPVFRGIS